MPTLEIAMLSMNDRFEINAALEKLLADGTVFDPHDATLLIEKVPLSRHDIEFSLQSIDYTARDSVSGYAAGRGTSKIEDARPRVRETGVRPDCERVGGYKLVHRPGSLRISLMWSHTKLELDGSESEGQSALLLYDRVTKRPRQLRALANVSFEFTFWPLPRKSVEIVYGRFVHWKAPSDPGDRRGAEVSVGTGRSGDRHGSRNRVDRAALPQAAS